MGRRGREGIRRKRKSPWPDLETEFTALARYVGPFSLTLSIFDDHFFVLFFFFLVVSILARKKENPHSSFFSFGSYSGFGGIFVSILLDSGYRLFTFSLSLLLSPALPCSLFLSAQMSQWNQSTVRIYLSISVFSFLFFSFSLPPSWILDPYASA